MLFAGISVFANARGQVSRSVSLLLMAILHILKFAGIIFKMDAVNDVTPGLLVRTRVLATGITCYEVANMSGIDFVLVLFLC